MGWTILGLLAAMVHWVIANGYLIAVPFFALPAVLLVLWTGSFAVSGALTVLEDTAAGNDVIPHWNDGGWGDWLGDSYGPVFLAAATWTACFPIAKVAAVWSAAVYWPTFLATFVFLFPIVLLSTLQAGSYTVPFTGTVLKSLVTKFRTWLVYYLVAGAVAAVYVGPLAVGLYHGWWFLTLILTGPLLSSVMLIEARLLGRLGWRVVVAPAESAKETLKRRERKRGPDETGKPRPRRRKPSRKLS